MGDFALRKAYGFQDQRGWVCVSRSHPYRGSGVGGDLQDAGSGVANTIRRRSPTMDRNISAAIVLCTTLWAIGAAFVGLSIAFPNHGFGPLGVYVAALAAVLQVHGFFRALVRREECAYHIGVMVGSNERPPSGDLRRLR